MNKHDFDKRVSEADILTIATAHRGGGHIFFSALCNQEKSLSSETKKKGIQVFHYIAKNTRTKLDYEHMKDTIEKRANGIEPCTDAPWGHWCKGFENCVLEHNTNGTKYLSFKFAENEFDNEGNESIYLKSVNGGEKTEISFEEYLNLCTPSVRKKYESDEKPPCLLVKFENIISLGKKDK